MIKHSLTIEQYKRITRYILSDSIKDIICVGDIHGMFKTFVYHICKRLDLYNTAVVLLGDNTLGFHRFNYYVEEFKRFAHQLEERNIYIFLLRGNHDNKSYYNGPIPEFPARIIPISDYSVIESDSLDKRILCIGGAISIDRTRRIQDDLKSPVTHYHGSVNLKPASYWPDEIPVFDKEMLDEISEFISINTVVTHTAPSFAEKKTKNFMTDWMQVDDKLKDDSDMERTIMDDIYNYLEHSHHVLTDWYYGHFHDHHMEKIHGVWFHMLGILEIKSIINVRKEYLC